MLETELNTEMITEKRKGLPGFIVDAKTSYMENFPGFARSLKDLHFVILEEEAEEICYEGDLMIENPVNTLEDPYHVRPLVLQKKDAGKQFTYKISGNSLDILRLTLSEDHLQ